MNFSFLNWIEILLLPPGLLIPFLVLSAIWYKRRKSLAMLSLSTGLLLIIFFSMPAVARSLIKDLQTHTPINVELLEDKQNVVMVVLGGGRYANAPEFDNQDQISPATLERIRYTAHLNRQLKLPMLLSGGRRNADSTPEAVMMNKVFVDEYAILPVYLEVNAANTHQQAIEVKTLLKDETVEYLILVTHAWHMRRAESEFNYQGFKVIPAPMGYLATGAQQLKYVPSAAAMAISARALHEKYALLWTSLTHSQNQTHLTKAALPE